MNCSFMLFKNIQKIVRAIALIHCLSLNAGDAPSHQELSYNPLTWKVHPAFAPGEFIYQKVIRGSAYDKKEIIAIADALFLLPSYITHHCLHRFNKQGECIYFYHWPLRKQYTQLTADFAFTPLYWLLLTKGIQKLYTKLYKKKDNSCDADNDDQQLSQKDNDADVSDAPNG